MVAPKYTGKVATLVESPLALVCFVVTDKAYPARITSSLIAESGKCGRAQIP